MSTYVPYVPDTLDCGHDKTPEPTGLGTGYAGIPVGDGWIYVCYPCAAAEQRRDLATSDTFYAYVGRIERHPGPYPGWVGPIKTGHITTWPGEHLMTITAAWTLPRNNFGGELVAVNATDDDGAQWYGRGAGEGCVIRLRRRKATPIGYRSTDTEGSPS